MRDSGTQRQPAHPDGPRGRADRPSKPQPARALVCSVLATATLAAVTGCGTTRSPAPAAAPPAPSATAATSPSPSPEPPPSVDTQDVDAVARAAAAAMYASDTTLDRSPSDTARRAAGLLSTRTQLTVQGAEPIGPPGATWETWRRHRAYLKVRVARGGEDTPPDTSVEAFRQLRLTVTPIGRDGWRGAPTTLTVYATLVRESDGWRLDSLSPAG